MKLSKLSTVTVLGLTLTLAAGCKTRSTGVTPLGPGASAHPTTPSTSDSTPGTALANNDEKPNSQDVTSNTQADPGIRKDWPRDHEIFKADTVQFDYDSSIIKESEKSKVAAVADYMKSHAADGLEIAGHCDERGTEEYNRSLGERRALALREELVRLGVDAGRVDTISFGEDRPIDPGHNEAAYRKNRRGEFALEKHQTLLGAN